MIDPEYRIKNTELVRIIDAFINFDSKALYEVMDEVRKREIKGNPALDQALNEGEGVYRP